MQHFYKQHKAEIISLMMTKMKLKKKHRSHVNGRRTGQKYTNYKK